MQCKVTHSNEMGLIPNWATNFASVSAGSSFNVNRVTHRHRCKVTHSMWTELLADVDAKLLTQCEQSYSQTQMQSYSLNVNRVTSRHRCKVSHSMWTELLADTDAKFLTQCEQSYSQTQTQRLAQCEQSYSQTQTQSSSLNVNKVTRRCKVTRSMWTELLTDAHTKLLTQCERTLRLRLSSTHDIY